MSAAEATAPAPVESQVAQPHAAPIKLAEHHLAGPQHKAQEAAAQKATENHAAEKDIEELPTSPSTEGNAKTAAERVPSLPASVQQDLAEQMELRLARLQAMRNRDANTQLGPVEEILLKVGPEIAVRIRNGEYDRSDFAIARLQLEEEEMQLALFAGREADARKVPLPEGKLSRLVRKLQRKPQPTETEMTTVDLGTRASTESLRAEYGTKDLKVVEEDLQRLDLLRSSVAKAATGRDVADPLFDESTSPFLSLDFMTERGDEFTSAVMRELEIGNNAVLKTRFEGKSLAELNPQQQAEAITYATAQAIEQVGGAAMEDLLKKDVKKIDTKLIDEQAQKLLEKPAPADIQALEEKVRKITEEFGTAEIAFKEISDPYEEAKKKVEQAKDGEKEAKNRFDVIKGRSPLARLEKIVDAMTAPIDTTGLKPEEVAKSEQTRRQLLTEAMNKLASETDKLDNAEIAVKQAEEQVRKQEEALKELEKTNTDANRKKAEKERDDKKKAKEAAEKELKEAKEKGAHMEVPKENEEKAKALTRVKGVQDNFDSVTNRSLSSTEDSTYNRERFADATEANGQVLGTELIRQFLLGQTVLEDMDRKIFSDETIARAIIQVYRVDTNAGDATGQTLRDLLDAVRVRKERAAKATRKADRENWTKDAQELEKKLIKRVLPNLTSSRFKAGDLMRYLAHEALLSAQQGNPYLELGNPSLTEQPIFKTEQQPAAPPTTGTAEIDIANKKITWTGETQKLVINPAIPLNIRRPLTVRIAETFGRDQIGYEVFVRGDEHFTQALPKDGTNPPDALRPYYQNGRLVADKIPEWVSLGPQREVNAISLLTKIDEMGGHDTMATGLEAATARAAEQMTNQERIALLKGFNVIPVADVPITENPASLHTYSVAVDASGEFVIQEGTGAGESLTAFYDRRSREYAKSLGVDTLSPEQATKQQAEEFSRIQQLVGLEIMRAQQRR